MVLDHAVDALQQACVGDKQGVTRPVTPARGHDRLVLDVRKLGNFECSKLGDSVFDLADPAGVEVVPVPVVVAPALLEQLRSTGKDSGVRDDVGARIDIAAQHSKLRPERWWYGEKTRARLVQADEQSFDHERVERVDRLGPVHPLLEPEAAFVEAATVLVEQSVSGIHLLPSLAPRRRAVERARESSFIHAGARFPIAAAAPARFECSSERELIPSFR